MFESKSSSDLGSLGKSPYSLRNEKNPYRGFGNLGAQTILNPIDSDGETMTLYKRGSQLRGLDGGLGNPKPASGFSGIWDEVKGSLFSPLGLLVLAGGVMVFGHSQGWWGKEKEGD